MSFIVDYFSSQKDPNSLQYITLLIKDKHPIKAAKSEKDIEEQLNKELASLESSCNCKRNGKAAFVYNKGKLLHIYSVVTLPLN